MRSLQLFRSVWSCGGFNEMYWVNRRIHADVIVYIFAHLHTALRIEGNMLDMN